MTELIVELDGNGNTVVRNEEQMAMVAQLHKLRDDCHAAKNKAHDEGWRNESLYQAFLNVEWAEVECVRAERWLDDTGFIGWRCYIGGPDRANARLLAVLRDTLLADGWDGVEVVPA